MEWQTGTDELTFEAFVSKLHSLIDLFESKGIRVPVQSRFRRVATEFDKALRLKVAEANPGAEEPIVVDSRILAEGLYDYCELAAIAACQPIMTECPPELRTVFKGSVFPWEEKHSTGRDLQFQLFVASVLASSGLPVQFAEPDIRFRYEDQEFAVAAKRVKSVRRLEERLKEGTEQISRTGLLGFVAVDMTPIARRMSRSLLVASRPEVVWNVGRRICDHAINRTFRRAVQRTIHPSIAGYFVSVGVPAVLPLIRNVAIPRQFLSIAALREPHPLSQTALSLVQNIRGPMAF